MQSFNDQASATLASQLFQRLVSAGAVAIAGSGDTGPSTSAMADRLNVPDIGAVDDAGITIYPNGPAKPPLPWVWSWGLNTFAFGGIDAAYALKHCKRPRAAPRPVLLRRRRRGGHQAGLQPRRTRRSRSTTRSREDWSSGATVGLTNEIAKIKASKASCVVVWLTPQDTARFVQTIKSNGVKLTVLGNDEINADTTFSGLAGRAANGAIGAELTTQLHPDAAPCSRLKALPGEVPYRRDAVRGRQLRRGDDARPGHQAGEVDGREQAPGRAEQRQQLPRACRAWSRSARRTTQRSPRSS